MSPAQSHTKRNVVHGVFQVFDRREDDFSVSLSLADDPLFWLRFDKDSAPGIILLTDFKAGDQSDAVMVRALTTLLSERLEPVSTDVIFHDLVPGDRAPAQYRVELNQVCQKVRGWSETAARLMGRSVAGIDLETARDKARLVIRLE